MLHEVLWSLCIAYVCQHAYVDDSQSAVTTSFATVQAGGKDREPGVLGGRLTVWVEYNIATFPYISPDKNE
jgi:hypothetical protein